MSPKRKSIVFDLEANKKVKVQRTAHRVAYRNDESQESPQAEFVSYMQPEILTLSFMLEQLDKCQVRSSCLTGKSKEEIQKLFLQHVTPKSQRHYPANRFGKVLSAMQKKYGGSPIPDWQKQVISSSGRATLPQSRTNLDSLLPATATSDRLKPPVESFINTGRKTIKLTSGGSVASTDTSKDKTQIVMPSNEASNLDKIDLLLKHPPKQKEVSKMEVSLQPSPKRILTLNTNRDSNASKKLKTEASPKKNSNFTEASTSQGTTSKHSSVSWP